MRAERVQSGVDLGAALLEARFDIVLVGLVWMLEDPLVDFRVLGQPVNKGIRKTRRKQLAECNSSKLKGRKLVES